MRPWQWWARKVELSLTKNNIRRDIMKKVFALTVMMVLLGTCSIAMASDASKNGRFIGGIGLGLAPTVSGFGSAYNSGAGIDGNLGFEIDENLAILLEVDSYIFSTSFSGIYAGEVDFSPTLKDAFDESKTKFHLLRGL